MNDRLARCAFKYIYIFTKYKWEKCLKYYSWNISLCYIYFFFNWLSIFVPLFQSDKKNGKRLFRLYWQILFILTFQSFEKMARNIYTFFTSSMFFLQFYYLSINCTLVCWIRVINLSKKVISSNNQCKAPLKIFSTRQTSC